MSSTCKLGVMEKPKKGFTENSVQHSITKSAALQSVSQKGERVSCPPRSQAQLCGCGFQCWQLWAGAWRREGHQRCPSERVPETGRGCLLLGSVKASAIPVKIQCDPNLSAIGIPGKFLQISLSWGWILEIHGGGKTPTADALGTRVLRPARPLDLQPLSRALPL